MQVELHPLDPVAKKRINDLLISDVFGRWIDSIRSELEFETHSARVDLVSMLADPDVKHVDMSKFQNAARLAVALEVIEEFAKTTKDHSSIKIV